MALATVAAPLLLAAMIDLTTCATFRGDGVSPPRGRAASSSLAAAAAPSAPSAPPLPEETAYPRVRIGMTDAELHQIFPGVELRAAEAFTFDTQGHRDASVHGVRGAWAYSFKDGKLSWAMFNAYEDTISQPNFERYLAAIDAIFADYTKRYGPPLSQKVGSRVFKDPRVEHHWGYDVAEAVWRTEGMKLQAEFTFMGGKGDYHFLVKMELQREDYPHF